MSEMTHPGEDHRHAVGVAVVYALLVAHRAAGLDHAFDPLAVGDLSANGK